MDVQLLFTGYHRLHGDDVNDIANVIILTIFSPNFSAKVKYFFLPFRQDFEYYTFITILKLIFNKWQIINEDSR